MSIENNKKNAQKGTIHQQMCRYTYQKFILKLLD